MQLVAQFRFRWRRKTSIEHPNHPLPVRLLHAARAGAWEPGYMGLVVPTVPVRESRKIIRKRLYSYLSGDYS